MNNSYKRRLVAGLFLFAGHYGMAQITFEPGYFISNDGKRTECQIKNLDWKSNPSSFDYRMNGTEGKGSLETISEFGITGGSVFKRFTVSIDRSSSDIESLTKYRNPEFKQETLFLRLLVAGKATLYMYEDQGLVRFFYSHEGSAVSQLVYKRYMQTGERGFETGYATENEQYKQDLFNQLKCASITQRDVENLKHERAVLMKFFTRYNECTGTAVKTNESEKPSQPMHFSLLAGVGFNTLETSNGFTITNYGTSAAFRFGAEMEAVLPFRKGLWSFYVQPVYQKYTGEHPTTKSKFEYASLDLGGGFRRYLFIKDRNSLYASLGAVWAFPITEGITGAGVNMVAGMGYRLSRVSGELSYGFNRNPNVAYQATYGGVIVTLGYRLK